MHEYETALEQILKSVPEPRPEAVGIADAHGRILLEDADSRTDLPPFDNSAMDGYAVLAADVEAAEAESPVRLRCIGKIPAGSYFPGPVVPGTCVRIFTGSPLPAGADAVVMQEETAVDPSTNLVSFRAPVLPGESVRRRGMDVRVGQVLARRGERLTSSRSSLLAAAGLSHLIVGRRPLMGILATGSELVEPPTPLGPGIIYESNRVGLAGLARKAGAVAEILPLVPDDPVATRSALERSLQRHDVVVTSGGVSVGEMDYVKEAFKELGGELQFWRVAIKPGKPLVFGRWGDKLFFGLPGNPVSAFVTFLLLVRPAVLRWQGAEDASLSSVPGFLGEPLRNDGERRHFMRVRVDAVGRVFSSGLQTSHALSSLAAADGLVDVSPATTLEMGAQVKVLVWE